MDRNESLKPNGMDRNESLKPNDEQFEQEEEEEEEGEEEKEEEQEEGEEKEEEVVLGVEVIGGTARAFAARAFAVSSACRACMYVMCVGQLPLIHKEEKEKENAKQKEKQKQEKEKENQLFDWTFSACS